MPANLTPEFLKARERFHKAVTSEEKLAALEEMLAKIPKHKGTDKMQADIRKKIARYRNEAAASKKNRSGASGYDHVPREGAGQVVLVGPPNSGKSSLLAAVSNAKPDVADYPFATMAPVPGMVEFEDIAIQFIDLPPLSQEFTEPWVFSLIRSADLALLVVPYSGMETLMADLDGMATLAEERHIEFVAEAGDQDPDARVRCVPARIVLTKTDGADAQGLDLEDLPFPAVLTSVLEDTGLIALRREVFEALRIIRVYTKLPGQKPDLTEPYTLPEGSTALDAVRTVHRDFEERLKYVRVWGSGKFDGQQVPSDHTLEDGDIIEIHVS